MAVSLSVRAQTLLKETTISPQIVLDIEGCELIFGAQPIFKSLRWDEQEVRWDSGLRWDGQIQEQKARDWISLSNTTTNITQQLEPDKSSTSSITTANIALVDKNGAVSKALAFDTLGEVLGRTCTFSIGFAQGRYPQDFQPILRGVIVDFYTEPSRVVVSVSSSEVLKRQAILEKFQTKITSDITTSTSVIPLERTDGFISSGDALTAYARIGDEIVRILSKTTNSITVQRGQLDTIPLPHDDESDIESFYTLAGRPLELALKLMHSKEGNDFFDSLDTPTTIGAKSPNDIRPRHIFFESQNIEDKTGLITGDFIQLDSVNNTGTYIIESFGTTEDGASFIVVQETLNIDFDYQGTFFFKSQYNVLPVGLGMIPSEIDSKEFQNILKSFSSSFVDYLFYIKDTLSDCKDFIDKEIFFPQGLYPVPRKARASVKFSTPPFSGAQVNRLNANAITNANKLKVRRSISKYYYNTFVYRYNVDSIEDRFLTGKVILANDSLQRLGVGKRQLLVTSNGLRDSGATNVMINNIVNRQADRYKFSPVFIAGIEVKYKDGYAIEIGDTVLYGGSELKTKNLATGQNVNDFELYEVINKSLNIKDGKIKLSLLQTNFENDARYGVVSFSSLVLTGSTSERLLLGVINDSKDFIQERDKLSPFIGERIRVRSPDYIFDEIVTLKRFDDNTNNGIILEPPLSFTPIAGYIVEQPEYENSSSLIDADYKLQFSYHMFTGKIASVADSQNFDLVDASQLTTNGKVYVHSPNYSVDSFEQDNKIDSIAGNTVTLEKPLPFLPQAGFFIKGSNFLDSGNPYLIL